MNARALEGVHPELVCASVFPRAHQHEEVRRRLTRRAEQVFAGRADIFRHIAQQQFAALGQRRYQTGVADTVKILCGDQHARIPRMQGKRQHAPAEWSNEGDAVRRSFHCAQIKKQFFGVIQSSISGRLEPAKRTEVFNA